MHTLHHLKHEAEAKLIMEFCYASRNDTNFYNTTRTLQYIINEVQSHSNYRMLRKKYNIIKHSNTYNILDTTKIKPFEFILIQIHSSDNHQSHAVCITKDYIFDCNAANALPMSLHGLNFSCGENAEFQGIVVGYHFLLRSKLLNDTTLTQQVTTQSLNLKYQDHGLIYSNCPYTVFANVLHNLAFEQESESIMRLKLKYIDLWHASKQSLSKLRHIAQ